MKRFLILVFLFASLPINSYAQESYVRLKDIARLEGERDNALIGYGVVVGLAGSGDSRKNKSTIRSISNTLKSFGVLVSDSEVNSRNAAAVMVTANIGSFAEKGDKLDVSVSAIGDARSLVGGTLLLTPLEAINGQTYAIAQGQISVGGYKFEQFGNTEQKNHPTVGIVPKGGTIERDNIAKMVNDNGKVGIVLNNSDFGTAINVADAIKGLGYQAEAIHSGKVEVAVPYKNKGDLVRSIAQIESLNVLTDEEALIIVNERTGTIVSGGNVKVKSITVAHGNLELSIKTKYNVSQPNNNIIGSFNQPSGSTIVTPDTKISINEKVGKVKQTEHETTVFNLVKELRQLGLSTRDVIVILQAADKAGAINGKLIIQ
ncbi:flagellar basal body P-ring protein FlgI [Vibrio sp. Of14-4]|uniref:Flagellar P-ring protein n=1 Tax=Vibrio tetraodonis subsp. pristinus TaxID=2695891 RepID=A0A6L8M3T8_9VIBR|nr:MULTISPECIES: flagellar basal body P-ring protein FlgI [Vibrio]MCG7489153.1 flagellar basal body P-ring protein FlgI [Vibrio sp. Of14-4]MYM60629.1 flagellar basal body P-ring protein FlgI [Vibrio tetraodonis subsp. pristinus]